MVRGIGFSILFLFVSLSEIGMAQLLYPGDSNLPDFPVRNIDTRVVQKMNGQYRSIHPLIPIHDMSYDGRIGLLRANRVNGNAAILPFYVMTPENVKDHLHSSQNPMMGANLVAGSAWKKTNIRDIYGQFYKNLVNNYNLGRSILCEKSRNPKSLTKDVGNPYVCGGGLKDCYDITVVTRHKKKRPVGAYDVVLTALDFKIIVENPKTTLAKIENVIFIEGSQRKGPVFENYQGLSEPVIVGDNRLLISRVYKKRLNLTDLNKNGNPIKSRDVVNIAYSVYNENSEPCNPELWKEFHPITHAHYDQKNKMKDRYKFARFPFRDGLGKLIPNGHDVGGSYPWMDKEAANLFYAAYGRDLFYSFVDGLVAGIFKEKANSYVSRNPTSTGGPIVDYEADSQTIGLSYSGFWTQGKAVTLDGRLNNVDYGFRVSNKKYGDMVRELRLYKNTPNPSDNFEQTGAGREGGETSGTQERNLYHPMLEVNTAFYGSIENRLNYLETMKPVIPRDVVWHMGSTRFNEELVFDDHINPYLLINAEMVAAIGLPDGKKTYNNLDGYFTGQPDNTSLQDLKISGLIPDRHPLAFQNSAVATSDMMTPPIFGEPVGPVRSEPIAKGGIFGKGLWLTTVAGLNFEIPSQSNNAFVKISQKEWYAGVFVDPRKANQAVPIQGHQLIRISGNGERVITLKRSSGLADHIAYNRISFQLNGKELASVKIPDRLRLKYEKWSHIGFGFGFKGGVRVYINGFNISTARAKKTEDEALLQKFFTLKERQEITLGSNIVKLNSGVKGWFDEFKVSARIPTEEEICNYARGTLVIPTSQQSDLMKLSESYSRFYQNVLAKRIGESKGTPIVCYTNYGNENMKNKVAFEVDANLANIPKDARSIRNDLILEGKFLKYGEVRPDQAKNNFCLSCHLPKNIFPYEELNIDALVIGSKSMQNDPRRQPTQPPRNIRGVIPANYFRPGSPKYRKASDIGFPVDQWISSE